ncbi:MAG TPA: copper-containing nitrite reductase [Thermomicrobiaceae bacterium]|nr:copper-containing nitrite reductase [Thermomicrobiaceae bacterium]
MNVLRRGVMRGLALVALVILSLAVASVGAWTTGGGGTQAAMNMTAAPDDAALAAEVAGLTRLPQPVVAPPVGHRDPTTVKVTLVAQEVKALLDNGVGYTFYTFNGTVPGPMIRVREGDTVELTLKNDPSSASPHDIDLHAVTGPGGGAAVTAVKPGSEATFSFKALHAGTYVYHCAAAPAPMHIANGMYGLIVVEPPEGLPAVDHEFYVMQGDFYPAGNVGDKGMRRFDMTKMMAEDPEYVVFNGSVGALTGEHELESNVGDTVRIFFGVGGPNLPSSFHIIGESFDSVSVEGGTLENHNVQTTLVPPGDATMVELTTDYPGNYSLVDHSLGRVMKGAIGTLHVDGEADPSIFNSIKPGDAGSMGH